MSTVRGVAAVKGALVAVTAGWIAPDAHTCLALVIDRASLAVVTDRTVKPGMFAASHGITGIRGAGIAIVAVQGFSSTLADRSLALIADGALAAVAAGYACQRGEHTTRRRIACIARALVIVDAEFRRAAYAFSSSTDIANRASVAIAAQLVIGCMIASSYRVTTVIGTRIAIVALDGCIGTTR